MRTSLFAPHAAVLFLLGVFVASADAEWRTVQITLTPEFVNINGTDYPNAIYEGFNGHLPTVAPLFSKVVATMSINFDGDTHVWAAGTTVELYDVHDPSNVIFTTTPGPNDLYMAMVFRPSGTPGNNSPYDRLEMTFRGPDTAYGEGYFTTFLHFPGPFDGNGTAVMPESRMLSYIDYWSAGANRADYFIASVTAVVVPEPAGALTAAGMLALLAWRRRGGRAARPQPAIR
jgi:hypothetical protein